MQEWSGGSHRALDVVQKVYFLAHFRSALGCLGPGRCTHNLTHLDQLFAPVDHWEPLVKGVAYLVHLLLVWVSLS